MAARPSKVVSSPGLLIASGIYVSSPQCLNCASSTTVRVVAPPLEETSNTCSS